MRIIIIEDEVLLSDHLAALLCKLRPDARIVVVLKSIREAIEWLNTHPVPDIIFSDIRLTDGLSFEIFQETHLDCPIVFTTAYDEYAIQAFSYNSIHYIQKPITEERLSEAFEKYDSISTGKDISGLMSKLVRSYEMPSVSYSPRIFVTRGDSVIPVLVEHISCINTTDKMATCHMDDGKEFVLQESIRNIVGRLDPIVFKRISRQWIINVSAIKQLSISSFGKGHLIMSPNTDIALSRDKYYSLIKQLLK